MKYFGGYLQKFMAIITGNHYSLVNMTDDDFKIGTTADRLFTPEKFNINEHPSMQDVFHIYLSKILYESPDQIKDQCENWGFDPKSIDVLNYVQLASLKKYSFSTQVAVIQHIPSKSIIIAFRGTEPMDLLQWLTDASTNFLDMKNLPREFNLNENHPVKVHAGFYSALGLHDFNPSEPIDFARNINNTPIFIQLIRSIETFRRIHGECHITITGHSLGGGLASLFSFVLLSYGYESSITGVFTYGQPLVGNYSYAQILNDKLGSRLHRWVNHCDIVTRIPVIELPSIAWYYARTPYSDALEEAANRKRIQSNRVGHHYHHSGLRFKIDGQGNLIREHRRDQGPIPVDQDRMDLSYVMYSIKNAFYSLINITPMRAFAWITAPTDINDHFPGDYARSIKRIVRRQQ